MTEGKGKETWNHTASIMAIIANANRDSKKQKRPFSADDFNPYAIKKRKKEEDSGKAGFAMLKEVFCGGQPKVKLTKPEEN